MARASWVSILLTLLHFGCAPHGGPSLEVVVAPPPARLPERTVEGMLTPSHTLPAGAPAVVVHVPEGADPAHVTLVVYLHGWEGCARAIAASGPVACRNGDPARTGWGIADRHDAAGTDSILVVPQLAFDARSSETGRFAEPGFAAAWAREVDGLLVDRVGVAGPDAVDRVILVAHSGGYRTLQALLANPPDWPIDTAVFLDGLYGGGDQVADWVLADPRRRAISVHTDHPDTTGQSRLLAARVAAVAGEDRVAVDPADRSALRGLRAVSIRTDVAHGVVPRERLADLLVALDVPARAPADPPVARADLP